MPEPEGVRGPDHFLERARILIDLRKHRHAAGEARRALRLAPSDPEAHRVLAWALWGQKRLAQAQTSAETAVRLAAEDAHAHSTLALVLNARGKKRRAREHYEEAITLDPVCACFHTRYAKFLLSVYRTSSSPLKDLERSWQEATSALRLDPMDADAHLVCARLLCRQNRFSEAETSARKALDIEPNLARAHEMLGDVYSASLRSAEAFQCLREALRLDPTNRWLKHKAIHALEDKLPILGMVWKCARYRDKISSLFWLFYMPLALLGGLISALLGAEQVVLVFQFALYAPVFLMVVLFTLLIGIDLALTLGVINGWIRI